MLHSLSLTTLSSSSLAKIPTPNSLSPSPTPKPLYLKFRTSYRDNLRYLRALRILNPATKNKKKPPSQDEVDHFLATVDFLKSKGFTDPNFARLAFLCPLLFSSTFEPTDVAPVFDFLSADLSSSPEQSRGLILRCPRILFSDVEFCLRPTLNYLRQLGVEDLSSPTNLNAHLLNTRAETLRTKIGFLRSIGFSHEEATRACVRLPAIFGYSIDNNLWPKYIYLVDEMERSVEELMRFPQYFGFSLEKRIAPRHLHLKERNVHLPLNRMLLWGDQKFYAKWK
ncbi:hypothetical protein FH972_004974 [Carpinus fangiana]|uniref:Uncharacterized protein n=1 Tax=Carpinus fangiana TaxID=176857 RepID=A0A5N6QNK0_9ROSI|nr:hypothetical protein FH972_004974 [Carpinus fangiana]